jgi:ABC-2 type transport system permease protein
VHRPHRGWGSSSSQRPGQSRGGDEPGGRRVSALDDGAVSWRPDGYAALSGRGIAFALSGGDVALLALGTIAGGAIWGAIGVGLGAIIRNQVGSIISVLAWGFVVENLLFAFVSSVGRFGPSHAQDALTGLTTKHLLPAAAGGAVLIAWAAALALAGAALTARRDVN